MRAGSYSPGAGRRPAQASLLFAFASPRLLASRVPLPHEVLCPCGANCRTFSLLWERLVRRLLFFASPPKAGKQRRLTPPWFRRLFVALMGRNWSRAPLRSAFSSRPRNPFGRTMRDQAMVGGLPPPRLGQVRPPRKPNSLLMAGAPSLPSYSNVA